MCSLKGNIHVYINNKKILAKKLKHRKHHAVVYKDIFITDKRDAYPKSIVKDK